jgi:hypothetical protein
MQFNLELVISVSSAMIALCALVLTIWEGVQARAHNRISVRPLLTTWTNNKLEEGLHEVYLVNAGIGPARISKFEVRLNGEIVLGDAHEPIELAAKQLFHKRKYHIETGWLSVGSILAEKEKIKIVGIRFTKETTPTRDELKVTGRKSAFRIEFESMYGEKFVFDTDDELRKQTSNLTGAREG